MSTSPPADRTAELARHAARRAAAAAAPAGAPRGEELRLDELLAGLPGNDFTTLLLHAHRVRARRRSFRDVRDAHDRMPLTHASSASARALHAFDGAFFAAAPAFDAIALAPVSPLGAAAAAGIDPNHALATLRLGELAADPTAGLALEAARRRRAGEPGPLRLCASQRVTRMQPITGVPGYTPHFQLAALASYQRSPRPGDDDPLERAMLVEHVAAWARLTTLLPAAGFRVAGLRVVFCDVRLTRAALATLGADLAALSRAAVAHKPGSSEAALAAAGITLPRAVPAAELVAEVTARALPSPMLALAEALVAELAAPLAAACPEVGVAFDLARIQALSYYSGPCLQLHVRRDDGLELPLGDGGALPWLGALLDDRRQRMVTTGLGAELVAKLFAA
jgi:Histidyl-tRNA synthetase